MRKQTERNLFILPSFSQAAEFYQHLLGGIATYEELGNRILHRIKPAYAFRQTERVAELSKLLINTPIKEYWLIGQYYLVWCQFREAKCNDKILERIIEQTERYKSKALISRGTFDLCRSEPETAIHFYTEALRVSSTMSDRIVAARGIAHAKSVEGFHASALRDLERLLPLLRHTEPLTYYEVLNSYAVELIEADRLSEAENVSLSVVSSSFAPYYPEWSETRGDISGKRMPRSVVTFSAATVPATSTLLHMPVREPSIGVTELFTAQRGGAVLDMQEWKKKKMTNKDERPHKPVTSEEKQARLKELEKLGGREMLLQIMTALGDESVENDKLRKALAVLEGLDEW